METVSEHQVHREEVQDTRRQNAKDDRYLFNKARRNRDFIASQFPCSCERTQEVKFQELPFHGITIVSFYFTVASTREINEGHIE